MLDLEHKTNEKDINKKSTLESIQDHFSKTAEEELGDEIASDVINIGTYRIQRVPSKLGFRIKYNLTDDAGQILLTAKERYYPAWRRFDRWFWGDPKWVYYIILIFPYLFLWGILFWILLGVSSVKGEIALFIILLYFLVPLPFVLVDLSACTIYSVEGSRVGKIVPLKPIKRIKQIKTPGEFIGTVRLTHPGYIIWDAYKEKQGTLQIIPRVGFHVFPRLEIRTQVGSVFAGELVTEEIPINEYRGYFKTTEVKVTDLDLNRPVFSVTTMSWRKEYQIQVQGNIEMFLMFALSIRFIFCWMTKEEYYDDTPSSED